jgi:hypothetical protein
MRFLLSGPEMSDKAKAQLLLKRAATSRSSGQWSGDDFDVLADGAVVGRIFQGQRG